MTDPNSLSLILILYLSLSLLSGLLLGAFFFGGLWWTVGKATVSPQPALWIFCSMMARTVIALAGFYFVSSDHWERLLACMVGFTVSRYAVMRLTKLSDATRAFTAREV